MWRWRVRAYSGAGHGPGYLCTVVLARVPYRSSTFLSCVILFICDE
jgi:hypothetical protein